MFKINLRRLLRVLFILGLLLPTYLLPSTSNVALAEGGLEESEALQDVEALQLEERGGACKDLEICIRRIAPGIGKQLRENLVLYGQFPEAELNVFLRNPEGQVVFSQKITHKGSRRLSVDLHGFEWETEGSHSITVLSSAGQPVGDNYGFEVRQRGEKFYRAGGRVQVKKITPEIGKMINDRIYLTGVFRSRELNATLLLPDNRGEVELEVIKRSNSELELDVGNGLGPGAYLITIHGRNGKIATFPFGIGDKLEGNTSDDYASTYRLNARAHYRSH